MLYRLRTEKAVMKKKLPILFAIILFTAGFVSADTDKLSREYLTRERCFSPLKPVQEAAIEHVIKNAMTQKTGGNYKVRYKGYTPKSMKAGIFKEIRITGKDVVIENINIPCICIKSLSDYNYIDYTKDPIEIKSDMSCSYDLTLSEESLKNALEQKEYQKIIDKVNEIAYPMFRINSVDTKIKDNRVFILMGYYLPAVKFSKNRLFTISSRFKVNDGRIEASDIKTDRAYGRISVNKVANLINLLSPIEYTVSLLNKQKFDISIENIDIVDNQIKINGKINAAADNTKERIKS